MSNNNIDIDYSKINCHITQFNILMFESLQKFKIFFTLKLYHENNYDIYNIYEYSYDFTTNIFKEKNKNIFEEKHHDEIVEFESSSKLDDSVFNKIKSMYIQSNDVAFIEELKEFCLKEVISKSDVLSQCNLIEETYNIPEYTVESKIIYFKPNSSLYMQSVNSKTSKEELYDIIKNKKDEGYIVNGVCARLKINKSNYNYKYINGFKNIKENSVFVHSNMEYDPFYITSPNTIKINNTMNFYNIYAFHVNENGKIFYKIYNGKYDIKNNSITLLPIDKKSLKNNKKGSNYNNNEEPIEIKFDTDNSYLIRDKNLYSREDIFNIGKYYLEKELIKYDL